MDAPNDRVVRIKLRELDERMQRGEPFIFIDARNPTAWGSAQEQLPSALRIRPDEVNDVASRLPRGRPIVAYCT
jgi:hypothetical protein